MEFRKELYDMVKEQPVENLPGILNDLCVILCSTLYCNAQGSKQELLDELLRNIHEIWEETTNKIGDKDAGSHSQKH